MQNRTGVYLRMRLLLLAFGYNATHTAAGRFRMFPSDLASAARFAVLATILAAGAAAQPSNGYVFVAPGGYACCSGNSPTLHFGVGGEYVIGKGFGAGAEIGGVGM